MVGALLVPPATNELTIPHSLLMTKLPTAQQFAPFFVSEMCSRTRSLAGSPLPLLSSSGEIKYNTRPWKLHDEVSNSRIRTSLST